MNSNVVESAAGGCRLPVVAENSSVTEQGFLSIGPMGASVRGRPKNPWPRRVLGQIAAVTACGLLSVAVAGCDDELEGDGTGTGTGIEGPGGSGESGSGTGEPPADVPAPRLSILQPSQWAVIPPVSVLDYQFENIFVGIPDGTPQGPGQLYVLIDTEFIAAGQAMPVDPWHTHVAQPGLRCPLNLTPGPHVVRLQYVDGAGMALEGDGYRDEISVFVEEGAPAQSVRFVAPAHGEVIAQDSIVTMAATGMFLEPAGAITQTGGHMHILVDRPFLPPGQPIPFDPFHNHYGDGGLVANLQLSPGEHTLRLQFADGAHVALAGDQYRDEIVVHVR